ncbi:MAG: sigma-54 dependent transcriptional regulator, partial [Ekhidna sp.]
IAAWSIHEQSKRAKERFHAINCAAIPTELLESEIFGHKKGAFSGAVEDREGAAEVANNGTLFLDEICEMSLEAQKKMLRFIQTGQYQKVGSDKIKKSDVRIICATNKDPLEEVQSGRFRLDLYYRLHVVPIHLPPLRERNRDLLLLADYFLFQFSKQEGREFKSFSEEAMQSLGAYYWPGNVRELENVIQNVVVLNKGVRVERHMLPKAIKNSESNKISPQSIEKEETQLIGSESNSDKFSYNQIIPLKEFEELIIRRAVELCDGNIQAAAAKLKIAPSTIYRKLTSGKQK